MDFGPVCVFWQSSSSTWQVLDHTGQLEPGPGGPKGAQKGARRARQKVKLQTRGMLSDEQFLTSPFLPRFHLFSHKLKFFWGGPLGPLSTPGPRGTCPGYPLPLSVGLLLPIGIAFLSVCDMLERSGRTFPQSIYTPGSEKLARNVCNRFPGYYMKKSRFSTKIKLYLGNDIRYTHILVTTEY